MDPAGQADGQAHVDVGMMYSPCPPACTQSSPGVKSSSEKMPNTLVKREQKRRPKPKDRSILICGVCGDKALGYNFDAITCESCKAFFRRNALKTKSFSCSFDGNCRLDAHTRKFCAGCRLKKCFNIGMKKDWILTDSQLEKRRRRNSYKQNGDLSRSSDADEEVLNSGGESVYGRGCGEESGSVSSSPMDTPGKSPLSHSDTVQSPVSDCSSMTTSYSDHGCPIVIKTEKLECEDDSVVPLTDETCSKITEITTTYRAVFDAPYDLSQEVKLKAAVRSADDLFNMTDMFIKRLIKFAKSIPEFRALKQEDQIALLKGGVMEIMYLRSATSLDDKRKAWSFRGASGGGNLKAEVLHSLGDKGFSNHINFVMSLHELCRRDSTIMILLFVIELFSPDRPNLADKELVSKVQEKFSHWMKLYVQSKYPLGEARVLYPKLLMKLTDVRTLGEHSSQMAAELDISRMEPLLIEVFNLK